MNALKVIAYIAAGILIFFGILFVWGAFSVNGQTGWIFVGLVSIAAGFGIIWWAGRQPPPAPAPPGPVTLKVDLPGDVSLDKLTCKSCGGSLVADNIKIVNGAPMVSCPYCGTTYQLTEEPKW